MKLALFLLPACAALLVLASPHSHLARRHPAAVAIHNERRQSVKRCKPSSSRAGPTGNEIIPTPTPSTSRSNNIPETTTTSVPPTETSSSEHSGDGTFYAPGLGACGQNNTENDSIVAVSLELFDRFGGFTGSNPNNNPICQKSILASYGGKTHQVKVVDRCTGCKLFDLDLSPSVFKKFADPAIGRIKEVKWQFI